MGVTTQGIRMTARLLSLAALLLALTLAFAAPAVADSHEAGGKAASAGECPALTKIKYPWVRCTPTGLKADLPKPLVCRLKLANGDCAASPEPWGIGRPPGQFE